MGACVSRCVARLYNIGRAGGCRWHHWADGGRDTLFVARPEAQQADSQHKTHRRHRARAHTLHKTQRHTQTPGQAQDAQRAQRAQRAFLTLFLSLCVSLLSWAYTNGTTTARDQRAMALRSSLFRCSSAATNVSRPTRYVLTSGLEYTHLDGLLSLCLFSRTTSTHKTSKSVDTKKSTHLWHPSPRT